MGGYPPAGDVLRQIAALVESGQIKPIISTVMELGEIQKAHALVEGKHVRGKVVLKVQE